MIVATFSSLVFSLTRREAFSFPALFCVSMLEWGRGWVGVFFGCGFWGFVGGFVG